MKVALSIEFSNAACDLSHSLATEEGETCSVQGGKLFQRTLEAFCSKVILLDESVTESFLNVAPTAHLMPHGAWNQGRCWRQ